jgi:serine/threonine protein kinase
VEERTVFQPSGVGSVRPGARLNGVYEIEKLVAQGGMGEVYRGFNIHTRDVVAIKMIRPESEFLDNPDVSELFRREASILFNLVHEAIVRYFTFSVDPDIRRAYLAMEFVDGPSLTKRLASSPLPLDEVRILQRRIGSALAAAHQLGVIHRDVSSDNIILPDGDVNKAKIIDFGIARSQRRDSRTIIGTGIAGKVNYMSPEQLGLAGGDVTFKSDIYSFGLVLAEALRGRPLDMSGSQAEIIEKRRVVPDLSSVDRSIRPLIQAMLQPLPEKRPASMAAVAAWESGEAGLAASRAPRVLRLPDAAREREPAGGRAVAMLAAVIVLASVGGAAYVFRGEIAQWGQSIVASAPPAPAKLPSVPETQTSALPHLPKEPGLVASPGSPGAASPASPLPPLASSAPPPSPPPLAPAPEAAPVAPVPEVAPARPAAPVAPAATAPPSAQGSEAITAAPPPLKEERASQDAASPETQQRLTTEEIVNALLAGKRKTNSAPPVNEPQQSEPIEPPAPAAPPPQNPQAAQTPGTNALADRTQLSPKEPTPGNAPQQSEPIKPPAPAAPPPQNPEAAQTPGTNAVAEGTQPSPKEPTLGSAPQQSEPIKPQVAPRTEKSETAPPSGPPPGSAQIARLEPPVAAQPVAVLAATAGAEFTSDLPRFSAGANGAALTLRAEPDAPPGLAFADLGFGASRISGTPTTPGPYAFDVVATEPSGLSARVGVKLLVAPAPAPAPPPAAEQTAPPPLTPEKSAPPAPQPQPVQKAELNPPPPPPLSPIEKARAFVKAFDGGDCFFIKRLGGADGQHAYQAVGRELESFKRFDSDYKKEVGVEADLTLALITPEECPSLDLVRLGAAAGDSAPRIALANYEIGRGKPLAGTIANLGGRRLYLVLVDNDGVARRLEAKTQPGGDAATFSVPITPRADSIGPMQVLLAIVSDAPIPALETFRPASLKSAGARLVDEARRASASVAADYFKFVN